MSASWIRFLKDDWKELLLHFGIVVLISMLMLMLEFYGVIGNAEGLAADWWLSLRGSDPQYPPLLLIEIDDRAYKSNFQSASPLTPSKILDLVWNLAAYNPRVIGVDLMTDSREYAGLEAKLIKERGALRVPVVWAAGGTSALRESRETFWRWLLLTPASEPVTPSEVLGKLRSPDLSWGIPLYPREEDQAVRRLPRQVLLSGFSTPYPTWATTVAERFCGKPCTSETSDEILIPYGTGIPRPYPLCDIIACPGEPAPSPAQRETFKNEVAEKLVLVGGTFAAARDIHFTPVGLLSGLALNAYAIRAEVSGGLHDVHHWEALLLDLLLGATVFIAFGFRKWKARHDPHVLLPQYKPVLIRWLYKTNGQALVGAAVLFLALFASGRLWLTWPGVLVGMMLALIVEIWLEKPEVPEAFHGGH